MNRHASTVGGLFRSCIEGMRTIVAGKLVNLLVRERSLLTDQVKHKENGQL